MATDTADDPKTEPTGQEAPGGADAGAAGEQPRGGEGAEPELRQTIERLAGYAHEAVDRMAERGLRFEERVRETRERGGEQGHDLYTQAYAYVREHPFASLGLAAAAGYIIGSLGRRR